MSAREKKLRVALILLAGAALIGCRHWEGAGAGILHSFGANFSFSFGAYFIMSLVPLQQLRNHYLCALATLVGVWAQEAAQGIGWYPGVFDWVDFGVDAVGVGLALALDLMVVSRREG